MLVGNLLLKVALSYMNVPNVANIVAPAVAEATIPYVLHAKSPTLETGSNDKLELVRDSEHAESFPYKGEPE